MDRHVEIDHTQKLVLNRKPEGGTLRAFLFLPFGDFMHILYRGPSALDGKEIVCIATGTNTPSRNRKTGPTIQTYILRADMDPRDASKSGEDYSICGDCMHRQGSCYVRVEQDPLQAYRNYRAGKCKEEKLNLLGAGRVVRLGAYGDPDAIPFEIWNQLLSKASGWLGYTHQWNHPKTDQRLKSFCQASVETLQQAEDAKRLGWRTYRTKLKGSARQRGEIVCPFERLGVQCIRCLRCNGRDYDVVVDVHGSAGKRKRFEMTLLT